MSSLYFWQTFNVLWQKKKKNVVCDMFCKHWMGDAMQMIFSLCH